MSSLRAPTLGSVSSADIAVPEHPRAVQFYARVLGTGAPPLWRDDLMNSEGTPVIGLGPRAPAYEGLPLQWMPHIAVGDVSSAVDRAVARGGVALMHGKGDDGASLWAVLQDPDGAAFGVIPLTPTDASDAETPAPAGSPPPSTGHIARVALHVADPTAARDFYCDVIGWRESAVERPADTTQPNRSPPTRFTLCSADHHPIAAIGAADAASPILPACWLIYLVVGELEESLRRVRAEGGVVVQTRPGSAVICDPVGAYFAIAVDAEGGVGPHAAARATPKP